MNAFAPVSSTSQPCSRLACIAGALLYLNAITGWVLGTSVPSYAQDKPPVPAPGVTATAQAAQPTDAKLSYESDIQPLLKKLCFECHGAVKPKSDVALHKYANEAAILQDRKIWEAVLEMIETASMPPENKPQPTAAERERLVNWLESTLFFLDCTKPRDPGRVTIRRLNRAEYNNTVRDLLGISIRPADKFPSDDVGEGFDNIGDVLSMPPLLLEKYLDAAEQVAAMAIVIPDPKQFPTQRRTAEQLKTEASSKLARENLVLLARGVVNAQFEIPSDGEYLLRVQVGAMQGGTDNTRFALRLADRPLKEFTVVNEPRNPRVLEVRAFVKQGSHSVVVDFVNGPTVRDDGMLRPSGRELHLGYVEVAGPVEAMTEKLPASHRRLVTVRPTDQRSVGQAAREVLTPLMRRAFRRPVSADEVDRFASLVELASSKGESFERGLQVALAGVLVSPHFLFKVEQDDDPANPNVKRALTAHELAVRLSYFLWSSMPDEELFRLADRGALHDDAVLEAQIARMLQDEKAFALVENFGGQWLNLRNLEEGFPEGERNLSFVGRLKRDMRRETELFFQAVMREDRSILEFLDADFTFVNERLARHYGLDDVTGVDFRRVSLAGTNRGGVLTQGSILTLTSNPTRTSPVKRGKWIMENILGTPPPEPPPDVPQLEATQNAAPDASLREALELHRKDPNCATCHRQMDALGFGFENFDMIGRWREKDRNLPIDASGTLPGGERFAGPGELVKILKARTAEFSRTMAERMLVFALGRGLQPYDRCATDKIVKALQGSDYRFSVLVTEIAKSEPFRLRRGEGETP